MYWIFGGVDVVDTIIFSLCFPPFWPCQAGKKGGNTASSHSFTTVLWSILLWHIILTLFFFCLSGDTKEGSQDEMRRDSSHIKPIWGREDDKPGKGTGAWDSCIILDLLVSGGGRICFCLLLTRRSGLGGKEGKEGGGWNRHDDEEEEEPVLMFASNPFSVTERQDAANLWLIFGAVVDSRAREARFE